MRVQWIELFRSPKPSDSPEPLIVHLIGDKDELVDREDSIDLEAGPASDVMIKTLEGLNHREIATHIYEAGGDQLSPAGEAIQMALTGARGEFPVYWRDKVPTLQTDLNIKHLIFVMHGIRDESTWPAELKRAIERLIGDQAATVKVIPPLYRRFTMLPFLLYWDRQQYVRWFMDQYTQAKAKYPNLEIVDFVGHSKSIVLPARFGIFVPIPIGLWGYFLSFFSKSLIGGKFPILRSGFSTLARQVSAVFEHRLELKEYFSM